MNDVVATALHNRTIKLKTIKQYLLRWCLIFTQQRCWIYNKPKPNIDLSNDQFQFQILAVFWTTEILL